VGRYSNSLQAGRSRDQIPMGGRFSTPIQTTPRDHPASCTVGTGSFWGVMWPGHGVDHPPLSSTQVKERVELYLYSPSGPMRPVLGWTLPYYINNQKCTILWLELLAELTVHVFLSKQQSCLWFFSYCHLNWTFLHVVWWLLLPIHNLTSLNVEIAYGL
jgi:hypothetical protein